MDNNSKKITKITSYGNLPEEYSSLENSKIVVIPAPFDGTSTYIKGADKGPRAIFEASPNMEFYDIDTDSLVFEKGIHTTDEVNASSPEKLADLVEKKVSSFLDKEKFVVLVGGEHSVSVGSFRAFAKKFKDLTILQLDAHSDLRDSYEGSKYNHACAMARAKEAAAIIQVGIRSMDDSEKKNMDKSRVFFAKDIMGSNKTREAWINDVVSKLTGNVYLTIDLDVFDPSLMPATGTPEPGGLFWYDVVNLIKEVIAKKNLVGFDVVELCPMKDNKGPDFIASRLIYSILSYKFSRNK